MPTSACGVSARMRLDRQAMRQQEVVSNGRDQPTSRNPGAICPLTCPFKTTMCGSLMVSQWPTRFPSRPEITSTKSEKNPAVSRLRQPPRSSSALRQIPVIQGDKGVNAGDQQSIHQPIVEIQSRGIRLAPTFRQDTRPGYRKAIGIQDSVFWSRAMSSCQR